MFRFMVVVGLLLGVCVSAWALSPGTTFVYQGQLKQGGSPAGGTFDFTFELFDESTLGIQRGTTLAIEDVVVSNGLFSVELDFGPDIFDGTPLWVEISVRDGGSTGSFTLLSPRQPVTATPYAQWAGKSANSDMLAGLGAEAFLQVDGSTTAQNLIVDGSVDVEQIVFPDGTVQTTASTSSLPTVTEPIIYTPAFLTCGTNAESMASAWSAIAIGTFRVGVDGGVYDVSVNFANSGDMDVVATRIEEALRGETSGTETVVWASDHFVITSGDTSESSAITPLEPHSGGVGIDISGAGVENWMDCDAGNGVVTDAVLNRAAYEGNLVLLDEESQVNPFFLPTGLTFIAEVTGDTAPGSVIQAPEGAGIAIVDASTPTIVFGGIYNRSDVILTRGGKDSGVVRVVNFDNGLVWGYQVKVTWNANNELVFTTQPPDQAMTIAPTAYFYK